MEHVRSLMVWLALACTMLLTAAAARLAESHAYAWASETPEEARQLADSLFRGQFSIDDANPEASVPSSELRAASPLDFGTWLMEVGERAERATQAGDHVRAVRYYRAVAKAVPDRAVSYAQLCDAYERGRALDQALGACAEALRKPGVRVADFVHYIRLVLAQPGDLTPQRVGELDMLVEHVREQGAAPILLAQIRCDVGVRLLDSARLEQCTQVLHQLEPESAQTIGYEWVLALQRRDYPAAVRVVERAERSAMKRDAVRVMKQASEKLRPEALVASPSTHVRTGIALALALGLLAVGYLIRTRQNISLLRGSQLSLRTAPLPRFVRRARESLKEHGLNPNVTESSRHEK